MVMFVQILGGALFVSVTQNMFTNKLVENLVALEIPGLDPQTIVNSGVTSVRNLVDSSRLAEVLSTYNLALVETFKIALILSCSSIFGAFGIEWKNMKGKKLAPGGA